MTPNADYGAPYYAADGIEIYHGDSREIDAWDIAGGVMITDPPYGIDHQSGHSSHMFGPLAWYRGSQIVNDEDTTARDVILGRWAPRPALVFGSPRKDPPPDTTMTLVWDKGEASGMGDLSIPWKPSYEHIYVIGVGFSGRRTSAVIRGNVPPRVAMGRQHPNEKPVALMEALIRKCPPLATIVDPFMGSGSTLVAAQRLGRLAIGIEIDKRYCEIAVRRLAQRSLFSELAEVSPNDGSGTDEGFEGTTVEPKFPVYCPHGRQVGWALRNEPTTVTDTRFCAPCHECLPPNDGSVSP